MTLASEGRETAAVLEPTRVHALNKADAEKTLLMALSKAKQDKGTAYSVVIYSKHPKESPNVLVMANQFAAAYRQAWEVANRDKGSFVSQWLNLKKANGERKVGNVRFFVGESLHERGKSKLADSPGVYIVVSRLDDKFLGSLGLPAWPKELRSLAKVVQVVGAVKSFAHRTDVTPGKPATPKLVEHREARESSESATGDESIRRDSLSWREGFMRETLCLSAEQVAEEAMSDAKNRASVASRWLKESRIFYVKYKGKRRFPNFEFKQGEPIQAVADVIDTFGKQANGWDLAYFFSTPNSYVEGRKPRDLLANEPARVVSLAKAFAHPADAF